jgi:hypothetical protein
MCPPDNGDRVAQLEAENAELRTERDELRRFVTLVRGTAQTVLDEAASFTKVR